MKGIRTLLVNGVITLRQLLFFFSFISLSIGYVYTGEIKIVTYEWAPYNYSENSKIIGISTEIVRAILNKANLKADYSVYPWARAYQMAQEEENVLIYTIRRTPEREHLFKWVGPITPPSNSFLYKLKKRKNIIINSLEDAKQYNIGVVNRDSMHQYLLTNGFEEGKNFELVPKDILNLWKIFSNRIDLIIWTELTLPIKAKEIDLPYNQLEKVFLLWKDKEGYYLAFSKRTSNAIVERARTAFDQIRIEGKIESAVERYLEIYREK